MIFTIFDSEPAEFYELSVIYAPARITIIGLTFHFHTYRTASQPEELKICRIVNLKW